MMTYLLCFQEASPSQVASAATLAVAFMETLSTVLQTFSHGYRWVFLFAKHLSSSNRLAVLDSDFFLLPFFPWSYVNGTFFSLLKIHVRVFICLFGRNPNICFFFLFSDISMGKTSCRDSHWCKGLQLLLQAMQPHQWMRSLSKESNEECVS